MVEAANSRDQIKQGLFTKADELFATFDTHNTVFEDASKNYVAKQTVEDGGNALTMVKWTCAGLTIEQLQPFLDDPVVVGGRINDKLTVTALPEDNGHRLYHC